MTAPPSGCTTAIFQEPWWLEAVAPGRWGAAEVCDGSAIVARLPFVVQRRAGITVLGMAPLTRFLGPTLRVDASSPADRFLAECELVAALIRQLPRAQRFRQYCATQFTNWYGFHSAGFRQTTRYTFRFESPIDPDAVWSGMSASARRNVVKSRKVVSIRDDLGLAPIVDLVRATYRRHGRRSPLSVGILERIEAAAQLRGCSRALTAVDGTGTPISACYLVGNSHAWYWLLAGSAADGRAVGAGALLAWEAIRHAGKLGSPFDFEGSMVPGIAEFYRRFGAVATGYHALSRETRFGAVARVLRDAARSLRGSASAGSDE